MLVSKIILLGKDDCRRVSGKSPTRGVVKPMVSGHTITKPTINLSRVNMQRIINNPSNLSILPEVATPPRNQELNSPRSPNVVTLRQRKAVCTSINLLLFYMGKGRHILMNLIL